MYTANSDMYLRLKNGKFEVRKTLSRGEWGVTQDDAGPHLSQHERIGAARRLRADARISRAIRAAAHARQLRSDRRRREPSTSSGPCGPTRAPTAPISSASIAPDGSLARFTSVCAPLVYRGDRLPAELYGNVFVAEPAANFVSRLDHQRRRHDAAWPARRTSGASSSRPPTSDSGPVYLSNAPDGTLYIVDMYRGVIQQRADITEYLRDYIVKRKLEQPIGLGRIYRVMHETTRRDTTPALSKATPAQLVATLSHPNGWWRDTAQRLLVERGDAVAVPALKRLAETAQGCRGRAARAVDARRHRSHRRRRR